MAWMPMAAKVPMMVENRAASRAMDRVITRALMMLGSWNSSSYQRKEKPSHLARLLPALKLCTISTMMGIYRKKRIRLRYNRLRIFKAGFSSSLAANDETEAKGDCQGERPLTIPLDAVSW